MNEFLAMLATNADKVDALRTVQVNRISPQPI